MKYKSYFKKYRKSDVEKYKNTSNKILQSERADIIIGPRSLDRSDLCVWLSETH